MERRWIIKRPLVKIWIASFFLYVLGTFGTNMLGWKNSFVQIPMYFFFLLSFMHFVVSLRYRPRKIIMWYLTFILCCFFSVIYSSDSSSSLRRIGEMITPFVFACSIGSLLRVEDAAKYVKYSFIVVSVPVGLYLVNSFSQVSWWSRLGSDFGMNENLVGLFFLLPFIFALTEYFEKRHRLVNTVTICVSMVTVLLSGSKKALFGAVLFFILLSFFHEKEKGKRVVSLFVIALIVWLLLYLIFTNDLLYNILGYRLSSFLGDLSSRDISGKSSTSERMSMIAFGINGFIHSPILGHGIDSFQLAFGNSTGFYAYAHNNFVELLYDLGLLGTLVYYSYLIGLFRCLIKHNKTKNTKMYAVLMAYTGLLVFYDIGMVSYYDVRIIILIVLAMYQKDRFEQIELMAEA